VLLIEEAETFVPINALLRAVIHTVLYSFLIIVGITINGVHVADTIVSATRISQVNLGVGGTRTHEVGLVVN